jgi:aminoglycoside 6'-N-acetyltransferase I
MSVRPGLFDNPLDREQARAFLNDPKNWLVLAYDGSNAVGMASATILLHPDKQPALFVNEVGVRDSHQRRGIGKLVSQALIDRARAEGVKGVWLGTETDNVAARALYRSLGGEEVLGVFYGWDEAF